MFIRKSMIVALGAAAGVLGAYGDAATLPQSFEDAEVGAMALTGWGGYGTIEQPATAITLPSAGAPCATATHAKNLSVDGWVTNDLTMASAASNDRQLDMLVKVAKPDDALDGLGDADAKFALAVDTDGTLKYYTGSAWSTLGYDEFAEGDWIRVAVLFDSGSKRCKVTVNGNAATTGYANTTESTANKGPWYPALNSPTTITSMKVVGTTALDDLVVTGVANSGYTPSYKDAEGHDITITAGSTEVPMAWYDKNNVATSCTTDAPDGSGMTIEQKYITGVPLDGSKFELKQMAMTKDGETVQAKVTLPAFSVASGYTAVLQTKKDSDVNWFDSDVKPTSGGEATINLAGGDVAVTYFRLIAKPDAPK